MKLIKEVLKGYTFKPVHWLIIAACLLWVFAFRIFIFSQASLQSDAVSYYEHFEYFLSNISSGVYPLWEPTRNMGVPIELFLRRIGSFNPLFLLIIFVNKLGLTYTSSYLFFLSGYFLLGMVGYYLIAKIIFRDSKLAFLSFLLLMFSSLGARVFDTYLIFTFVPLIWFFYFLLLFIKDQSRLSFLGMTFVLMIITTTYIPFYFFLISFTFLTSCAIVYLKEFKSALGKFVLFSKNNKLFVLICLFLIIVSLIPGYFFFLESKTDDVVLPMRHYNWEHTPEPDKHIFTVDIYNITKWSMLEDVIYAGAFDNLRHFRFAVIYVPAFAYLLLLLGAFFAVSRKLLLLIVWAVTISLMCSPHFPFYEFFYKHVFFFKMFRNLHFFLWLILLPLFILFIVEQSRHIWDMHSAPRGRKRIFLIYALLVHSGFLYYVAAQQNAIPSTYFVIFASMVFFFIYLQGWLKKGSFICLLFTLVLVSAQPVEVYHHLGENYKDGDSISRFYRYSGEKPYSQLVLPTNGKKVFITKEQLQDKSGSFNLVDKRRSAMYIGAKWTVYLYENLNRRLVSQYASVPLLAYDQVKRIKDEEIDVKEFGQILLDNRNIAYVSVDGQQAKDEFTGTDRGNPRAEIISRDSDKVQILSYNINALKVKTNFPTRKFLVFNDSYHSGWHAAINGQPVPLYRANVAFKGLWVPQGENIVSFRYLPLWRYWINIFIMVIYNFVFYAFIFIVIKQCRQRTS